MNYIDIIICIPLLWGLYRGFVKGLILEAATLIALGLGIWGGLHFSEILCEKLRTNLGWETEYLPLISFAIIFLSVIVLVFFIGKLISKLAKNIALGGVDKIFGAILGSLKYALVISIIIFIIDAFEKSYPDITFDAKKESLLYEPIGKIAPLIIPALDQQINIKAKH